MRRSIPTAGCALVVFLLAHGCAGSGSDTTQGTGDNGDGGTVDASIPTTDGATADSANNAPDTAGKQACVHNSDCTMPNLCSGTNGVACVGGFCVPTGKSENCDDGVACTDDSCDANTNMCVHKPNDASCPNGAYCDPVMNCVQTLPCMAGDSVCDRLNTTSCAGLWSCDATKMYCVHAAAPCPDRANAMTNCTATTATMATCAWACDAMYVDLNGDLMVPPPGMSDGCECHATDPRDTPTLANVDGNCDGIVGNITHAIFVDTVAGLDTNPGTMALPVKTIKAGIGLASAASKDVYVSKGEYDEEVTMSDGVGVYGGYDASNKWARAATSAPSPTIIKSPAATGVLFSELSKATEIQFVSISSADAGGQAPNGDGLSSYGVLIANATGLVTVRGCNINSGAGSAGAAGAAVTAGAPGGSGGGASGTTPGFGGMGCMGANGGVGGAGIDTAAGGPGGMGQQGTQVPGGGMGAPPGGVGQGGSCSSTNSQNGPAAPSVTTNGYTGFLGTIGTAGASFGAFDTSGNYLAGFGSDGASPGTPGGGGGGGGAGSGSGYGTPFTCTDCNAIASGGGGGGGGGGCGGNPGHGGRGGGGSFGIAASSSQFFVDTTTIVTRDGGQGGNGGQGGGGGAGGPGGPGAGGNSAGGSFPCNTHNSGAGAAGSAGGAGGPGGAGAGGSGGPSVCVAASGGSQQAPNAVHCTFGAGGTGGNNGMGTTGYANDTK